MKHAMTIDVEDYFQVAAFNDVISADNWHSFKTRVEKNTHCFLDVCAAHDIKATFFILGWIAEKHPALVREIADAGHEIACHGYSHQLIYEQDCATFAEETTRAKSMLEDQAQVAVEGYRAASYSVTSKSLWALDVIQSAGFTYDSSIYPIRHDRYGLQGGPLTPHTLRLKNGAELKEFPITTASFFGMDLPVGGGGYFRIYPLWLTSWLLKRRCRTLSAPFVFYLHPWELDPEQPRVAGVSLLSRFRHYTNLDQVESRLNQLMTTFEFTTMKAVLDSLDLSEEFQYQP